MICPQCNSSMDLEHSDAQGDHYRCLNCNHREFEQSYTPNPNNPYIPKNPLGSFVDRKKTKELPPITDDEILDFHNGLKDLRI